MAVRLLAGVASLAMTSAAVAQQVDLPATPATVSWGHYDASATPVITVRSGDEVVVHTLLTNSPKGLESAGLPPDQVTLLAGCFGWGHPTRSSPPCARCLTACPLPRGAPAGTF